LRVEKYFRHFFELNKNETMNDVNGKNKRKRSRFVVIQLNWNVDYLERNSESGKFSHRNENSCRNERDFEESQLRCSIGKYDSHFHHRQVHLVFVLFKTKQL
jgi:hypothetical protein